MSLTKEELRLIGGSDAAAIAGVHPYKRPIDVWRRIVEGYETPTTPAMKRGLRLEPIIREMFAEETGLPMLGVLSLRSPKHDWLRASLDDHTEVDGEKQVVEFKSVNVRQAHRYGEGADELPDEHICQVQFYLAATGWRLAHLGALLGGDELRTYRLIADHDLQRVLFEACEQFWVDYVKTKRAPPVDGSNSYGDWIDEHFTDRRSEFIPANEDNERLMSEYHKASEAFDEAEARKKFLRQQLEVIIGDAAGIEGQIGRISFKRTKDVTKVDWEGLAANLNPPPELVQKFTAVKAGSRRFLPTWRKAE